MDKVEPRPALAPELPKRRTLGVERGLLRRVWFVFSVLDLPFGALMLSSYRNALGVSEPSNSFGCTIGVHAAAFALVQAVTAWILLRAAPGGELTTVSDAAIERCGRALDRFPIQLATVWGLRWLGELSAFSCIGGRATPSWTSALISLGGAGGALLLGHAVGLWSSSAERALVARERARRKLGPPSAGRSLRFRTFFYVACLALAPSAYLAALVLSHAGAQPGLSGILAGFWTTIVLWAGLCAYLFAETLSDPLEALTHMVTRIARQGSARALGRLPVERLDELGRLLLATNEMIERLEQTELAREQAASSLAAFIRTLEAQVTERTLRLSVANTNLARLSDDQAATNLDMQLVLDNVPDGFLCVDRSGCLVGHRSRRAEQWFGVPTPGQTLWTYLGAHDARFAEQLESLWFVVSECALPLALALDQCPRRFTRDGVTFDVSYRSAGAEPARFVIIVRDITAELEGERAQVEQRELAALLAHLVRDRAAVEQFVREAERIGRELSVERPELRALIHTLKGNAAMFGLNALAGSCEQAENELEESCGVLSTAGLGRVRDALARILENARAVLGAGAEPLAAQRADLNALLSAVRQGLPRNALEERLAELRYESVQKPLARAAAQARELALQLGKGRIDVQVDAQDVRCSPERWSAFWAAFVHAVRNAVDHGLEPPDERSERHKAGVGRLMFTARAEGGQLCIELEDDGRGVAWERVARRAKELGLTHATRADLVRALFSEGFSTANRPSEVSGRGMGLSALASAARALGGAVSLASETGEGTTLSIVFPLAARNSLPARRVSGEFAASE